MSHSTAECYVKDYAAYKRTEFVTVSSCNDQDRRIEKWTV